MKQFTLIVLFLISSAVAAQGDRKPWLQGGLGWSSDGQYIAVGTSAGVHIHASDDLSKLRVLDGSFDVRTIAWSNTDLRIAYFDFAGQSVVVWDLATDERSEIQADGGVADIAWAPTDKLIAVLEYGSGINIYNIDTGVVKTTILLRQFRGFGTPLFEWSPDGRYISYGAIEHGFAIFNAYTGDFLDFNWSNKLANPLRWSPDGNLLAGAGEGLRIWKINQILHPHDTVDKFIDDVIYERPDGRTPNWHPDSSRIAFVYTIRSNQDPLDFSGSHAVIWDLVTDTDVKLPGVFITFTWNVFDVIDWSPDGSKLASISSDGRIVIWDARSYEIVVEFAGYPDVLDTYGENR